MADLVIKGKQGAPYAEQHNRIVAAARFPVKEKIGYAVVQGLDAWSDYAKIYREQFGTPIGAASNPVLSHGWLQWAVGLLKMVSPLSGLDHYTVVKFVNDTCREHGVSPELGAQFQLSV